MPTPPRVGTTPATFDAHYYGHTATPTANYRNYGPPDWAPPLADWLGQVFGGPFLDVGCAFGHLVAAINRRAVQLAEPEQRAVGAEWSPYATARGVTAGAQVQADGRALPFRDAAFGCTVSLDFLEHHTPADSARAIAEIVRVTRPGGYSVHLIGAATPETPLESYHSDPTHLNPELMPWYEGRFAALGCPLVPDLTTALNDHPFWRDRDWRGRWRVFHVGGALPW